MHGCSEGEAEEARCACMFCGTAGHESELACSQCSRMLPFCIASGTLGSCQALAQMHSAFLLVHFSYEV